MEHKHDNEAALSTRIRFRLKTQLFLSVFKKIRVHTRTGKRRFRKVPLGRPSSKSFVSGDRPVVYVWTECQSVKKMLRFQKYPDMCVDVALVKDFLPPS